MYLVSACLIGINTRYDGGCFCHEALRKLALEGRLSLSARNSSADVRRRGIPVRYRAEAAAMYWMAGAS